DGVDGEMLCQRYGNESHYGCGTDLRWRRLHARRRCRAIHARRQDQPDLRRHQPDPARDYFTQPARDALMGGSAFRPVATRRAFEEITAQIRDQLARQSLKTGDRLPPERDLADQFGVSRNTLREALRSLEIAGLLELKK